MNEKELVGDFIQFIPEVEVKVEVEVEEVEVKVEVEVEAEVENIVSDIIDDIIDKVVSNNKSEIWCCHEDCLESIHPFHNEMELKSHTMAIHGRKSWLS